MLFKTTVSERMGMFYNTTEIREEKTNESYIK